MRIARNENAYSPSDEHFRLASAIRHLHDMQRSVGPARRNDTILEQRHSNKMGARGFELQRARPSLENEPTINKRINFETETQLRFIIPEQSNFGMTFALEHASMDH